MNSASQPYNNWGQDFLCTLCQSSQGTLKCSETSPKELRVSSQQTIAPYPEQINLRYSKLHHTIPVNAIQDFLFAKPQRYMSHALQVWQANVTVTVIFEGVCIFLLLVFQYLGAYLLKQFYSTCTCWI